MNTLRIRATRLLALALMATTPLALPSRAVAAPVPCIVCGSVPLAALGVDGTVSYAVISGAAFTAEVAAHGIGFFGLVPPGTFSPPFFPPAPTDYVYLYQLVNSGLAGANVDFISGWTISGGGIGIGGPISPGPRLESTLFVDPNLVAPALISAGPVVAATAVGLSPGPLVDFQNGLGFPLPGDPVPPWGPCLGSGVSGVFCSDGSVDLLAASLSSYGWLETPSGGLLDPFWSSSVIWFSSPFAPMMGTTTIVGGAAVASGGVPVPGVPEPASVALLGIGLAATIALRRRRS